MDTNLRLMLDAGCLLNVGIADPAATPEQRLELMKAAHEVLCRAVADRLGNEQQPYSQNTEALLLALAGVRAVHWAARK